MENIEYLDLIADHLNNGRCVFFLGAGFSIGALNHNNNNIPNTEELKKLIYDAIIKKEEVDITESITDLTNYFVAENENKAHIYESFFIRNFGCSKISNQQNELLKLIAIPGNVIFTTNYDDIVEHYCKKHSLNFETWDLNCDENIYEKNKDKVIIIHIHGGVSELIKSTKKRQFKNKYVLGEISYLTNDFCNSSAYYNLTGIYKFIQYLMFIGYSARYDFEIRKTILDYKNKNVFINKPNSPKPDIRNLKSLGTLIEIDIEDFVNEINKLNQNKTIHVKNKIYNSLKPYLKNQPEYTNNYDLHKEINDLFKFGINSNFLHFILDNNNDQPYLMQRKDLIENIKEKINSISDNKNFILLHGEIASGKTALINLLAFDLMKIGEVYHLEENIPNFIEEIKEKSKDIHINKNNRLFIIIDGIQKFKSISQIGSFDAINNPNVYFILSVRSNLLHSFVNYFDREHTFVQDINQLSEDDYTLLDKLLINGALWGNDHSKLEYQRVNLLREEGFLVKILMKYVKPNTIIDKDIKYEFDSLEEDEKHIICVYLVINSLDRGKKTNMYLMSMTTDFYTDIILTHDEREITKSKNFKNIKDIFFSFTENQSLIAPFSQYILQHIVNPKILLKSLVKINKAINRNNKKDSFAKSILLYSNISSLFLKNNYSYIEKYYIELNNDLSSNPHYWLQRALSCIYENQDSNRKPILNKQKISDVKNFFKTARSQIKKNADSIAVENHLIRFLVHEALFEQNINVAENCFDEIRQLLINQFKGEFANTFSYACRSLLELQGFLSFFYDKLRLNKKTEIFSFLQEIQNLLKGKNKAKYEHDNNFNRTIEFLEMFLSKKIVTNLEFSDENDLDYIDL